MSYAHTKRRKRIAFLKHEYPRKWREVLRDEADEVTRKQLGPCLGTAQDIVDAFDDALLQRVSEMEKQAASLLK